MKLRLPTNYSQQDNRWARELLGFNTSYPYNIYNYGCLITCIAMVTRYYGKADTPSTINEKLKKKDKFVKGTGLYKWGGIESVYTTVNEKLTRTPLAPVSDAQMQEIRDSLDKGYPVMVQLDYDPSDVDLDMHYVLIIGYNPNDENDFTIVDPIGGVETSMKKYVRGIRNSARKAIHQYIIYEGKPPAQGSLMTWEELKKIEVPKDNFEGKRKTVEFYFREWEEEKKRANKLDEEMEYRIQVATEKAQSDANTALREVQERHQEEIITVNKQHAKELALKQKEIDNLVREQEKWTAIEQENAELKKTIERLKKQSAQDMPLGDLLELVVIRLKSFFNKQ